MDETPKSIMTVAEVAKLTGFSAQTITRLFKNEPGIIMLDRPERLHKRRYRSIRIPRIVFERVFRRVTVGPEMLAAKARRRGWKQ